MIKWRELVKSEKIFVKVNLISSEFVPGQCTSPLILSEVLHLLHDEGFDVCVGDSDLATSRQCNKAAIVWNHKKITEQYNFRFQNLSDHKLINVKVNGRIFKTLDVPQTVLDSDSVITLPVLKTHYLTGLTCGLKNSWGVCTSYPSSIPFSC